MARGKRSGGWNPDGANRWAANERKRRQRDSDQAERRQRSGRITDAAISAAAISAAAQGLSMVQGGPVVDPLDQLTDYTEYSQQETRDKSVGDANNKPRHGDQSQRQRRR